MAQWTQATADAAAQETVGGGAGSGGGFIYVPGGIITEGAVPLGGIPGNYPGGPTILPPAPLENAGCTSGCGVPYPNSSPATVTTVRPASSQVRTEETPTEKLAGLFAGWKDWPWWVWVIVALVVMLLLKKGR